MTNRTRLQSMAKPHKYDQKAEKTKDGELVSSYMCSPESAAEEFEISKRLYYQLTGRSQPKERDVLMYRIIQSFKPGEVTPEQANEIAYELAMKFTGGRHQFVVATHTDRAHIHSHIEINSTNLDCNGKLHIRQSARVLQRLNDDICRAHGLSVITEKQRNPKAHGEAMAMKQFTCDQEAQTATFTPSREDSYERLLAAKTQFPSVGPSVEEQTIARLDMKALMRDLTEEERGIIWELYYLDKSEREASAALHLAKTTFRRRKKALLEKLRNLLNEN